MELDNRNLSEQDLAANLGRSSGVLMLASNVRTEPHKPGIRVPADSEI